MWDWAQRLFGGNEPQHRAPLRQPMLPARPALQLREKAAFIGQDGFPVDPRTQALMELEPYDREAITQGLVPDMPIYPGSMHLPVEQTPEYPEFMTRPQRAFRMPTQSVMRGRTMQPTMGVMDIADEGGAISPQVQIGSSRHPIQRTSPVMPANTIDPMRLRGPRQLPGIDIR